MRRSAIVTLTLVPALAASFASRVARADDPAPAPPTVPESSLPADPSMDPYPIQAPGMTEQVLMPPGMTPPIDCDDDPDSDKRPECQPQQGFYYWNGTVIRGGFGQYFWVSGG